MVENVIQQTRLRRRVVVWVSIMFTLTLGDLLGPVRLAIVEHEQAGLAPFASSGGVLVMSAMLAVVWIVLLYTLSKVRMTTKRAAVVVLGCIILAAAVMLGCFVELFVVDQAEIQQVG